jgi:homoserine kinase type II
VALNAWCFEPDGSFNITSARALVAGYESRRPLSTPSARRCRCWRTGRRCGSS